MANLFDQDLGRFIKAQSRTPLSDDTKNLPSHYIEVNPKINTERTKNQFGAVIVRFHWDMLAQTIAPSYFIRHLSKDKIMPSLAQTPVQNMQEYKDFRSALTDYFVSNKLYDSSKSLDEQMNRFVNDSLVSARTSIADKIGSGTAHIVLENLDNQWIFQSTDSTFSDLFGDAIFMEGLYITIEARGRFDPTIFYRIFTGSVKSYTITDNPVQRSISIECRDLSKLLTMSRYNVHPALFNTDIAALQGTVKWTKNNLQGLSNVDIAKAVIPNINEDKWSNPTDKYSIAAYKEMWSFPALVTSEVHTPVGTTDIVQPTYRYKYSETIATYDTTKLDSQETETFALVWGDKTASGGAFSDSDHSVYAQMFNNFELYTNEFQTRSEILDSAADLTFFYTYLDSSGNLHFHPSRHDYLSTDPHGYWEVNGFPILPLFHTDGTYENPYAFILDPGESLGETYSSNEDVIFTNMKVLGESAFGIFGAIQQTNPTIFRPNVVWWDGMKRFGLKEKMIRTACFQGTKAEIQLKQFGLAAFMRTLMLRKTMSCTIPMRPELDIDRPFFVPGRNRVYHIKAIQHSYTAGTDRSGGEFTTTVTCDSGRSLDQARLITTNLFRTESFDTLITVYKNAGFNIDVDIGEL